MDTLDSYTLMIVGGLIVGLLLWSGLDFVRDMLGLLFGSNKKRD